MASVTMGILLRLTIIFPQVIDELTQFVQTQEESLPVNMVDWMAKATWVQGSNSHLCYLLSYSSRRLNVIGRVVSF